MSTRHDKVSVLLRPTMWICRHVNRDQGSRKDEAQRARPRASDDTHARVQQPQDILAHDSDEGVSSLSSGGALAKSVALGSPRVAVDNSAPLGWKSRGCIQDFGFTLGFGDASGNSVADAAGVSRVPQVSVLQPKRVLACGRTCESNSKLFNDAEKQEFEAADRKQLEGRVDEQAVTTMGSEQAKA